MALTEIYVDPSIAADSGSGTIGDPYGDLEYAIEQETFDTTNGTRINVKAGTDEILAAPITTAMADTSVSVAWVPNEGHNGLVIQGYTSTAGDGGIGGISGGGSVGIAASGSVDGVHFIDMHLHNTGAQYIVQLDNGCSLINCELDNTTSGGIDIDLASNVVGCYIHDIGGIGITVASGLIERNFLKNGATNKFVYAISHNGADACVIKNNIISVDGTSTGMDVDLRVWVDNNSIYSNGGSGTGIDGLSAGIIFSLRNNLIEGFSDTGGVGIDLTETDVVAAHYGGNAVYNCATAYSSLGVTPWVNLGDNETLSASPFTDAANDDFSPVDTGNVKEGSIPASFKV